MANDDSFLPTLLAAGSDPLVRTWLKDNHDTFLAGLTGRLPDWDRLAKAFGDAGFKNKVGGKPNKEQLRKLWRIVRREVAVERAAKSARPRPVSEPRLNAPADTPIVSTTPDAPKSQSEALKRIVEEAQSKSRKFPDPI